MTRGKRDARFALIGYGAIAAEVVRCLEARSELRRLAGVLVRPARLAERQRDAAGRFPVLDRLEALFELAPDCIAECAGHAAVRELGPAVLQAGCDLVVSSVGALADSHTAAALAMRAQPHTAVWIPSGAVAGIDGLLAARTAGLREVTYTSVKPPHAWKGTPAESSVSERARMTFFEGTAREAALAYPQNANVGATVALAGLGLDRTAVRLVSDPAASGPLGIIEAAGDFGAFRFEILAYASRENPKTSALTAHSIVAALRDGVRFRVAPGVLG